MPLTQHFFLCQPIKIPTPTWVVNSFMINFAIIFIREGAMKILTVDIGTGTQDIFLYDSRLDLENGFKLIVPSPTMIIHKQIKEATRLRKPILLSGYLMGGGPNAWAAQEHIRAGNALFATPDAARSFNDDLKKVEQSGVQIVSNDEASKLPADVCRIELRDFDYTAIDEAFSAFGVSLDDLDAIAVAVFDHGNAPADISDRKFRFDYLDARIRAQNRLSAFAFQSEDIPTIMTRMQAVAASALANGPTRLRDIPLIVMDTAPAAVLGTTYDPIVRSRQRVMIVNIGNLHTLAFRLGPTGIEAVFEHHTGLLDKMKLDSLLSSFANGTLTREQIFSDHGHGALIYSSEPLVNNGDDYGVVVTGPRRMLMDRSKLHPYFAVPFGDMMIAGCFGLLAATADLMPELREEITCSLEQKSCGAAPWEIS